MILTNNEGVQIEKKEFRKILDAIWITNKIFISKLFMPVL